ncbi:non-specific lipid transfer protein GPI-anchored 1-like [Rutidosis leptorrhynchoides]|uniref:non-specific lipid transfer protein GPI-anchored 1-like n=1 Tax=Rutidosis leptorrhynchoides TaxID=125765 RepID=UPI003A9A049E
MAVTKSYCLMSLVTVSIVLCGFVISGSAQSLAEQCSQKLPQVMTCVAFASGKEDKPEQKCCDSVMNMKESNPACLCFLIQQIHNGTNPALQKMNIQETRLLQLPSACKIANASISDCPKLLNLPPNSPDAAIFNNVSSTITPTTGSTPSSPTTAGSYGFKYEAPTVLLASITICVLSFLVY